MGSVVGPLWTLEDEYSMYFNGTDSYLDIDLTIPSVMLGNFSMSFWIKADAYSGYIRKHPVSVSTSVTMLDQTVHIATYNSPFTDFVVRIVGSVGGTGGVGTTVLNDGSWHHIAYTYTYDGVTTYYTVNIYVDGNPIPEVTATMRTTGGYATQGLHKIGALGNYVDTTVVATSYYPGLIDEVSAWDRALSVTEITALYSNGRPIKLHNPPFNPISWHRMGDNGVFKDPQWLLPENSNKDKASNYSLSFTSSNDYIKVPTNPSIYPTTALAISIWVKLDTYGASGPYPIAGGMDGGTGYNKGYAIHITTFGQVYFRLGNGGSNPLISGNVPLGVWTHLLCNYNGTEMETWVNGVSAGNTTTVSSPIVYDNTTDLYLGSRYLWGTHQMEGCLNHVAIFNTDHGTDAQAMVLYNNGITPELSSLNPVGYWKIGDTAYSAATADIWVVPDSSTNSNDGSAVGMAVDSRIGDAPNSTNNGLSTGMTINDRTSDVPT